LRCPVCDHEINLKAGKPHSLPQHRRFFGIIRALALRFWPETHPRQFDGDEVALRKYLIIRAGSRWREVKARVSLGDLHCDREVAMLIAEATIRAGGSYCIPVVHNNELVVLKAKSVKIHGEDRMPHSEFNALSQAVEEVIRAETGLDPDVVLAEFRREA
jgi:hypothetical protein